MKVRAALWFMFGLSLAMLIAQRVGAQVPIFNVQKNGTPQFSTNYLQHADGSTLYNFCDLPNCATVPPPPNDPGAYTSLAVTWINHGDRQPHITDATQCANLWGRIEFRLPVQPWPYANGAEIRWQKTDARYLRCHIVMPVNPGSLSIFFKIDSNNTTVPVRFALVPMNAPWPMGAATSCYTPLAVNNQPALWVNPGTANRFKCSVLGGAVYDLLIDATNGQRGLIGVSKN